MKSPTRGYFLLACAALLLAGCGYSRIPEEVTDDGLVRVPSRAAGGVYRAPGAEFGQYKRLILEPPTIEFMPNWREQHPEVSDREALRLRDEAVKLFHDEFKREFVDRGNYEFAETPGEDVLLVIPRVVDLDIPAPDAGRDIDVKTYTQGPVKMQVVGELRDASSNQLVGRVIVFEGQSQYSKYGMHQATRASNAHEMRLGFAKWSKIAHEALYVAKASRPDPPQKGQ